MRNTFGNNIQITLFGESHGEKIGALIDGLPSGIAIDEDFISLQLKKRRSIGDISTARKENDAFFVVSGVNNGVTTGAPVCILIENSDVSKKDYDAFSDYIRPSHIDYSLYRKHGKEGLVSGGGHYSGRLTAPIVAAGAVAIGILKSKGIFIATHIKSIKDISDRDFCDIKSDIEKLDNTDFAVLDENAGQKMKEQILLAKENSDSVGGVLETVVFGMTGGVGEPWFDSLEGMLSHAIFSVPAVKGIEFGRGFSSAYMFGSENNDQFYIKDGKITTKTNNSGGILGGISNGEPIVFRTAFKPTPTISKEQNTVNIKDNTEAVISFGGRHDPCIVHRARVVIDSMTAITLLDMLYSKYGAEGLKK